MPATAFDEIYSGTVPASGKSPDKLFGRALNGAITATSYAEILLTQALRMYGPDEPLAFPDTAYFLPVIASLSGEKVTRLGDLPPILNRIRHRLAEKLSFANALQCGEATAYAAEII